MFKLNTEKKLIEVPFKVHENAVVIEIAFNFLIHGLLIVPNSMKLKDWMNLYEVADYFVLENLKNVVIYCIWSKVEQNNIDEVLNFSMNENLDELAASCAKLKIKNL